MKSIDSSAPSMPCVPTVARVAFWISAFLLAFDFKGAESGGLYQIASFLVAMGALGMIALLVSMRPATHGGRSPVLVLVVLAVFLVSTLITAGLQQVPFENYRTVVAPYVLFTLSFWFASSLCRRYGGAVAVGALFPILRAMIFVSVAWTLAHGLGAEGATISTARYRVVSVLVPLGIAYVISGYFAKALTKWDVAFSALLIVVLVMSQTRSYLLVVTGAALLITWAYARNSKHWLGLLSKCAFGASGLIAIGIVGAVAMAQAFPNDDGRGVLSLWHDRLFSASDSGFDVTTETRLAEYSDQMTRLFYSPFDAVVGKGLGAPYSYSGIHGDNVVSVLGADAIPEGYWDGGHSLVVYPLFASGLLFSPLILGVLTFGAVASFRALNLARRLRNGVAKHACVTLAVGYLSFMITGLTAYPLGARPAAFLMGVSLALILGMQRSMRAVLR